MTDNKLSTREIVNARLKQRYSAEARFKWFGILMTALAIILCFVLVVSIGIQSAPAMTESRLKIDLNLVPEKIDPDGTKNPANIRANADISALIYDALLQKFPNAEKDNAIDTLMEIVTPIATTPMAIKISKNPQLIGRQIATNFAVNDDLDMYFKNGFGKAIEFENLGTLKISNAIDNSVLIEGNPNSFSQIRGQISDYLRRENDKKTKENEANQAKLAELKKLPNNEDAILEVENEIAQNTAFTSSTKSALQNNGELNLSGDLPSIIVYAQNAAFIAKTISPNTINAQIIASGIKPTKPMSERIEIVETPANDRSISDNLIALGTILKNDGLIKRQFNLTLFTRSDSNDAEMAGVLSAIIGSILTLFVTFVMTVPIGVMAAIYLEEFAPKNAWTDFIEVNINNLAAVPSIVFGLLGFSVFLHFFGMPRSAPLVGGIVLGLMSLPVAIIASRAALKSVPPSIREAALGVGASKVQAVFHHVLPLAVPGMMTGSILAMARAMGETAPLLMIGMVAFIADVPKSITDASTVLPVEIFMWVGRPERAWDAKTSAAIIILLLFMLIMNAVAIILRRKFERRW